MITDVLTPRPWVNVLSNDRYGLVLSQAGGGFSWADNCQLFRLSRWEQDLVKDEYGRFMYVVDLEQPEQVWSTTYQPTRRRATVDEVRHELGATEFLREFAELRTKQTVFVPADDCAEVWLVAITNLADRPRKLRLGAYLEWHLGGIGDWHREFHRLFMESKADGNMLTAWKHPGLVEHKRERPEATPRAFIAWNGVDKVSWVTDKLSWLGRGGSQSSPEALQTVPGLSSTPRWDDPVGAGITDLQLAPHETVRFTIVIGAAEGSQEGQEIADKYTVAASAKALEETIQSWRDRCNAGAPASSEPAVEMMARTWLPYQAIAGRLWAKCAYYQQGGAFGFRDQLQDSLMLLDSDPDTTLLQLGRHAEAMYEDGGVRHWWHPNTSIFVESRHSDTCLWLAFGVLEYLNSTQNYEALHQEYAYLNRETQQPASRGSLWDHCLTGINRALDRCSDRGLPLIGAGDWNDGLSHVGLEGRGESVWMAMFLYDILTRWQPHLVRVNLPEVSERFCQAAHRLKEAVNLHAWDGEWYLAGTRDDGKPFGSSSCAVQAFSMLGDKETAKHIYLGMLPPLRAAADADLYAAEPYVMPGNIDGPDSPYAGRAGWTWYTGSAAWMRRVIQYL